MASVAATPARERTLGLEARGGQDRATKPDDETEWWKTMFKIAIQTEDRELRDELQRGLERNDEQKRQHAALRDEHAALQDEHRQCLELVRELGIGQEYLKNEIAKNKQDFGESARQIDSLQQLVRELRETIATMSQKRRQDPEDDDGDYIDDDGNDRPSHCKRVRATSTLSGFSRERIKYALGGFDRGWGSMQCRPQMKYTHYALLDVKAHLFDLEPSHGEPIAKAIFGFHLADEEVISGGIEFPLFVRSTSENRSQFKYVGNYVAKKLCLIAWERLSREGREDAIKTVRFRGLSDKHYFNSLGKEAAEQHIHRQFETGVYQVPCCRLDFRSYDEDLKTDIQLQAVPLREKRDDEMYRVALPSIKTIMSAEDPAGYEGKGKEIQIADLEEAERLKQEGNNHFRSKAWEEALAHYRSALGYLPRREHEPPREPTEPSGQPDLEVVGLSPSEAPSATPPQPNIGETPEMVKMRAVLNGNVAACYVQLGEHNKVVEACTEALADDPTYVKALQRRAASNEAIASWSALTSAQEDYRTLLKLLPESSPQRSEIDRMLRNLGPRIEMKRKEEMGEMMGKLKELGNSFLGNFGLSTDNFKFEPSGQGGYSVNFSR